MKTIVLIPAYKPDNKMLITLAELDGRGLDCLVVNDGSGDGFQPVFEAAERYATVIGYAENAGKGYALKYGIRYVSEHMKDVTGFVTADADGQHSADDIVRVKDALEGGKCAVLGIRDLSGDIPLKSRLGNGLSRVVYTLVTGKFLHDNQAGLRGFSTELSPWLLSVEGDRYEYEMNVLTGAAGKCIKLTELPIQTIYTEGNKTSHFNAVKDTLRIQGRLLKYGTLSALSYILLFCGLAYFCIAHGQFTISASLILSASLLFLRLIPLRGVRTAKKHRDFAEAVSGMLFVTVRYSLATTVTLLVFYITHSAALGVVAGASAVILLTYGLAVGFNALRYGKNHKDEESLNEI